MIAITMTEAASSDCAFSRQGRKRRNCRPPIAPVATAAAPTAQQIIAAPPSCRLRHGAPLQGRRREGEGDCHGAQADAERGEIEPAVAAGVVEDPATECGAE